MQDWKQAIDAIMEQQDATSSTEAGAHTAQDSEADQIQTIHIFFTDEEEPVQDDTPTVESTLHHGESTPEPAVPPPSRQSRRLILVVGWTLSVLLAVAGIAWYILAALTPTSATITIIPASLPVTTTAHLTLVAGTPDTQHGELQGRLLSSLTISQARTVATTGKGHQDAQAATGSVTLYNAATYPQTIPAGTLLLGADGVQIVTDQDAVIPAASYPTFGQQRVAAHATSAGPAGNIKAGDIYGPCCRQNISAVNSAFHGGQDARSFPVVAAQDITQTAASLTFSLRQSVQSAMQAQAQPTETLITPIPCTSTVTSDHQTGQEATQVSVTVQDTCQGMVYPTQTVQRLMEQRLEAQAAHQLGVNYTRTGEAQVSVTGSQNDTAHHTVTLTVTARSTWAYQFTAEQVHRLTTLIAGKNEPEATRLLLHSAGVYQVANMPATLPTDPKQIHLLVLDAGA